MSESPLVSSYQSYQLNPNEETYNTFGVELLRYIKATIAQDFGSRFEAVEDAIGESSIKILQQLPNYNPKKSPFPVWVKVIVRNTCTDILRGNQANKQKVEEVDLQEADRQYDFFSSHDNKIALNQIVTRLSKPDQALVKAKLDGLTDEEIAHRYGITQQAANSRWLTLVEKMKVIANGDPSGWLQ